MKYALILLLLCSFAFGQNLYINQGGDATRIDTLLTEFAYIKNKAHGFYGFEDSAVTPDLTQNTWQHITNATNSLFTSVENGDGIIIVNDTFYFNTQPKSGTTPHLLFDWGVDGFSGINEDYEVRVFNVTDNRGVVRKAEGSGDGANNRISIGTTSYDGECSFGDKYVLQIINKTNNNDFTFENGSIYVEVSHY